VVNPRKVTGEFPLKFLQHGMIYEKNVNNTSLDEDSDSSVD